MIPAIAEISMRGTPTFTSISVPFWQVKVDAPVKFIERNDTSGTVNRMTGSAGFCITGVRVRNIDRRLHIRPSKAPFATNARKGSPGSKAGNRTVPAKIPPVNERAEK